MKKIAVMIGIAFSVSSAWATLVVTETLVTDDFNRAVGYNSAGTMGTAVWTNGYSSNSQWGIADNEASANLGSGSTGLLVNKALGTTSGNGSSFTLNADVKALSDNKWAGVLFNYTDENNYYYFRYKSGTGSWAVQAVKGGVTSRLGAAGTLASGTFSSNTYYTLTVTSSNLYDFGLSIKETSSGTVVLTDSRFAENAGEELSGGYGGLHQGTRGNDLVRYDNFSLEMASLSPVTDDFNRPDSGMNSTGATVGPDWHSSRSGISGQWGIVDQRVVANMTEANSVLYNTVLETISGNGTNFTASLDVKAFGPYWAGLAFNYQNPTNFYYFRYKGTASDYQMYRVVDNVSVKLFGSTIGGAFATNTDYTLTVASSNAYEFSYEIKETGGAVLASGTATDTASSFTGGYAGILETSTGAGRNSFDNFSLSVGPAVIPGYAGWAAGWGVDIGAETNDYDLDGLLNIYEYGLGGDPTDPGDQGTSPEFFIVDGGGSNVFNYVYPQRSDPDSGLAYSLALRTNLLLGDWATNTGYTVTGTNVTGGTLDFVTNVTDTLEANKFIRLIIE